MNKSKIAVVIPVHNETMNGFEKISFERTLEVFGAYDIFVVGPKQLNFDCYSTNSIQPLKLDPIYFGSIGGHNRLLMSNDFYQHFEQYEYVLEHHLDAFTFKEDVEYWCELGYDYIGGPWLDSKLHHGNRVILYSLGNIPKAFQLLFKKITGAKQHLVGNGGFSLRKIASSIEVLSRLKSIRNKWGSRNEDVFWSLIVPNLLSSFKVAPFDVALQFAFDMDPEKCYRLNNNQLPFGCHAWSRVENINFWKPIIEQYIDQEISIPTTDHSLSDPKK